MKSYRGYEYSGKEHAIMFIKTSKYFGAKGSKVLLDAYALETGKIWCCSNGIFCARGFTAYQARYELDEHLKWLGQVRANTTSGHVRC